MLDENLPTFYLSAAKDKVKHHAAFYLTRGGSEPEPAYALNYSDPAQAVSKNCYAVGLFDPFNHDVLYGEILVRPEWTQPTLSAEEIRRNGGVPPPPDPLMPTEFTIQLYNPDQQVKVTSRSSAILNTERFDFSLPQHTFRLPSASLLDRSGNDPTADANTPTINFTFKRESKLSREFVCYLRGKSTDIYNKKKSKEPDITIALFRSLREVTIYESNLHRVETEDPKGLEVVLLLAAAAIKDIWFGNMHEVFNISNPSARRSSSAANQARHGAPAPTNDRPGPSTGGAALGGLYNHPVRHSQPDVHQEPAAGRSSRPLPLPERRESNPPAADARTQWQIDAETARLKAQVEAEEREMRRREEARRRERELRDEEETRRLRKMVEAEEKERVRKQKEAEKETKRLQKLYGNGQTLPHSASLSAPLQQAPFPRPQSTSGIPNYPQYPTPHAQASGALPPPQPPRPAGTASPNLQANAQPGRTGYLGSMLDMASNLQERHNRNKVTKKKSSIW